MTDHQGRATSFGTVAESYDRVRPWPPAQALDWLVPAGCGVASTAWHWFDPARAVPEIARVLRPGGRLGVIWTSRDREQDWVAELDLHRHGQVSDGNLDQVRARLERHHTVTLPAGSDFEAAESASFSFMRTVSIGDVVEWLATNSAFITAAEDDREVGLARCRPVPRGARGAGRGSGGHRDAAAVVVLAGVRLDISQGAD